MNAYPNDGNYPTPSFDQPVQSPSVDPDEGDLVAASFNAEWIPVMEGALDSLLLPSTWQGTHDEIVLALERATTLKALIAGAEVPTVPAPYWDDGADVDDVEPGNDQRWYGEVTDPEAPPGELDFVENAAVWAFTGFLAVAATPAVAILFRTIAPKMIIATRTGDFGAIIRIILDGEEKARVDTSVSSGEIINTPIEGNPLLETHDLYLINVSPSGVGAEENHPMQVVRKRLGADELDAIVDIRQNPDAPCELDYMREGGEWTQFADLTLCAPGATSTIYDPATDEVQQCYNGACVVSSASDPRHSDIFRFPATTGSDAQCNSAASMVRWTKDFVDATTGNVEAGTTALSFASFVLGLIGTLFPPALFVALFIDLFNLITATGATVVAAAFTSTVYDQLLCIYYCHMGSDGQVSASQLTSILTDIDTIIGGVAATVLHSILQIQGEVGLSNAGTLGLDTDDCSGCDCGWCVVFDFRTGDHGFSYQYHDGSGNLTGAGWETSLTSEDSGNPSIQAQDVFIERDLTGFNVTHITAVWKDAVPGGFIGAPSGAYAAYVIHNSAFIGEVDSPAGDFTIDVDVSGDAGLLGAFARMGYNVDAGEPGGNVVLQSITITGSGAKPTGGDDC